MMSEPTKVFGIGFHKTGTTSLGRALQILGYRVCAGLGGHKNEGTEDIIQTAYSLVDRYDAFQDNPWPLIYRELDRRYPNSKFILIIRPTKSWIKSIVNDFGYRDTPMREMIYGVGHPQGNEEIYIKRYESHNAEVIDYFKNRPNDLLVLHLNEDNLWEKICPFLEKEIPSVPFPHSNKGKTDMQKMQDKFKRLLQKIVK